MTRRSPRNAPRYHVGGNEWLTSRQIARIIGGTPHNVRARIALGWKGEALLTPLGQRKRTGKPKGHTQVVAYKLALKFGRRIPTTKEIIAVHPMEESNACYWRNAIIRALEDLS